jgi:hypothetical protein
VFTWRLWRALNGAQFISPLFRRVMLKREREVQLSGHRIRWLNMSLTIIYILLPLCMIFVILPVLVLLYFAMQALSPVLVPLAYSVYGLALAVGVSGSIAREHELNTYEVLGVSPPGRLGMHWLYCVGWMYRSSYTRVVIAAFIGLGVVAAFLGLAIPVIFRTGDDTFIDPVIRAIASGFFFAIDFVQTIVIASLIAMFVPAHIHSRAIAHQIAAGSFIAAQLGSYVAAMLVSVVLYRSVDDFVYPILIIGVFALLREGMITALWFSLCDGLNSNRRELRF